MVQYRHIYSDGIVMASSSKVAGTSCVKLRREDEGEEGELSFRKEGSSQSRPDDSRLRESRWEMSSENSEVEDFNFVACFFDNHSERALKFETEF